MDAPDRKGNTGVPDMKNVMLVVMCIVTSLTGIAQQTSKTKHNIPLAGRWTRDVKNWVFQFDKDGTFRCLSSTDFGKWVIVDDNKVRMDWLTGPIGWRTRTYTLQNENEFNGNNPGLGRESFKRQIVAVDINPPSAEDGKPAKPADPDIARQPSIEVSKPETPADPDLSRQTTNEITVASDWTPNSAAKIKRDALNVLYTNALAEIEVKVQKAKGEVLGKYGKELYNALATLKTKGLFDDYKLILKESDRFSIEKTIPVDPKSIHPNLAIAITECQKQLSSINNKAKELAIENTKNYIKALRELVKQTMIKNMMGDAEKINEEIKSLSGMIAEQTTGLVLEKGEPNGSRPTKEVTPKSENSVASPVDGTRFVVECNGSKVTNALIVVYAGGGTGFPFMTWGRKVIDCGITQSDGVKLNIPPGKYKYQVNVFASGYQFYSGKDEEIKGDKFVIKIKKQANTRGADRWIYLPRGTGVPVFSNSKDPEIEVVFMSHTCPPEVKTVNSDISFHHGLKQVTTHKTFDVYKGDVTKKPKVATCEPIWYFGLDGRDCPSGLVILVKEK
jgi:hypothetical protein